MPINLSHNTRIALLLILHTVGLVGLLSPFQSLFLSLSALNLIVSAWLIFPKERNTPFWISSALIFVSGFVIEWLGVSTGKIFGVYHYGDGLQPLLFGIPLIIGLNWWLLCYTSIEVFRSVLIAKPLLIFSAAAGMVFLDLAIEQVAPALDYWHWQYEVIPVQNYLAWFAFGLLFILFLYPSNIKLAPNKSARALFFIQLSFFILLILFL